MPARIRLKRMGSKKKPFYRIVATDSRMPRDGRFVETLGYYNPIPDPPVIEVKEELIFKWFERGAKPTDNAASLLRTVGCLQKWELMKQGLTGEALEQRVIAIKNQRAAAAARKQAKKRAAKAAKDEPKDEKKAEAAETAPAERTAGPEAAPKPTPSEAPSEEPEA